jgi:hypothetical protein
MSAEEATSRYGALVEDVFSLIQWPAFAASLVAAWLVASKSKRRRNIGFWVFLASNVLWGAWGVHTQAWALIALQVCLAALNIRGLFKTEDKSEPRAAEKNGDG